MPKAVVRSTRSLTSCSTSTWAWPKKPTGSARWRRSSMTRTPRNWRAWARPAPRARGAGLAQARQFLGVRVMLDRRHRADPVGFFGHAQVLVEQLVSERVERTTAFGIGQDGDAQLRVRHHDHLRIKALQRAAVHGDQ